MTIINKVNEQVFSGQDITGGLYLISKKSVVEEIVNITKEAYYKTYESEPNKLKAKKILKNLELNIKLIRQSFDDIEAMYLGKLPGYKGANTKYHDLPHTYSVTLATARLMYGYEISEDINNYGFLGVDLFTLGIVVALFHDSGYVLRNNDRKHKFGAEYTKIHVTRGAKILAEYINNTKLKRYKNIAAKMIHYTGMEKELNKISFYQTNLKRLAQIIGSADYLAQMSDCEYLEKCRDYLYEEFVHGGVDIKVVNGKEIKIYASAEELLKKTSSFFSIVTNKFAQDFDNANKYEGSFFNGKTPYFDGIVKNINYINKITSKDDISKYLRRLPNK